MSGFVGAKSKRLSNEVFKSRKTIVSRDISRQNSINVNSSIKNTVPRDPTSIVSARKLESILSLLPDSSDLSHKNADTIDESGTEEHIAKNGLRKSTEVSVLGSRLNTEQIIDSVMQDVIKLNRNKLPESSLLKVLASVYIDAKSKLENKNVCDSSELKPSSPLSSSLFVNSNSPKVGVTPSIALTFSEKKKMQWEKEKAELAILSAVDPWSKLGSAPYLPRHMGLFEPNKKLNQSQILHSSQFVGHLNPPVMASSCDGKSSTVTPWSFTAGEDVEKLKREEQRRQWKSDLDDQVRQRRILNVKNLEAERRTDKSTMQRFSEPFAVSTPRHNSPPSGWVSCVSTDKVSSSQFPPINHSHASSADSSSSVGSKFHRTRGFMHELYSNPVDELARAYRAEEVQRCNLEQIEERRRLRDEAKTRRLLEDRLEEERLERDRARLKELVDLENRQRESKWATESLKAEVLAEALKKAREEAAFARRQSALVRRNQSNGPVVAKPECPQTDACSTAAQFGSTYTKTVSGFIECDQLHPILSGDSCSTFMEDAACQTASRRFVLDGRESGQPSKSATTIRKEQAGMGSVQSHSVNAKRQGESVGRHTLDQNLRNLGNLSSTASGRHNVSPKESSAFSSQSKCNGVSEKNSHGNREMGSAKCGPLKVRDSNGRSQIPVSISRKPNPVLNIQPSTGVCVAPFGDPLTDRFMDSAAYAVVRTDDVLNPHNAESMGDFNDHLLSRRTFDAIDQNDDMSNDSVTANGHSNERNQVMLQRLSEIRKGLQLRQSLCESGNFDEDT